MRFGSVCSGIEAASVAFGGFGWEAAWFSEIEPFPCAVLNYHYPKTPNHGDVLLLPERILAGEVEAPELLVGGTPCQAFSLAGKRGGLNDSRGNLLTPIECERLQGFPDDYTRIPWKGKPAEDCPDGPRYKSLGNSWAVPCAAWVGGRIFLEIMGARNRKSGRHPIFFIPRFGKEQ